MTAPSLDDLLAGPRFRMLCMAVAEEVDDAAGAALRALDEDELPYGRLDELEVPTARVAAAARALAAVPLGTVRRRVDPLAMFPALGYRVDTAMPWQPPEVREALSALPTLRDALRPVAEAVLAAPASAWWDTGIDPAGQWAVSALRDGEPEPVGSPGPAAATLDRWHANVRDEDERARAHHAAPVRQVPGGAWWSTPHALAEAGRDAAFLPSSSRRVGALGATGLALVEDGFGDEEALLYRVTPAPDVRVYEVRSSEDWRRLVERYPMDVQWARRGVWWRSTGREVRWYIPDHRSVARDFDAVHVTVAGYLATAGRAIDVLDGATVLAGWAPDASSWLTDAMTIDEQPERWRRVGDMHEWKRTDARTAGRDRRAAG